jgi:hypothetical protein
MNHAWTDVQDGLVLLYSSDVTPYTPDVLDPRSQAQGTFWRKYQRFQPTKSSFNVF